MEIESVQKIKRSTLPEDVIHRIKFMIENNQIKSGEKLPTERELAKMFGVGRSSVREAMRVLQSIGTLDRRQGVGTYLNSEAKQSLKRVDFTVEKYTFLEMSEARKIIEVKAAQLAAERADPKDIRSMETAFKKHSASARCNLISEITVLDFNFHRSVARAAHNDLLLKMFDTLRDIMISSNYVVLTDDKVSNALSYHAQIMEAIKKRDQQRAKTVMEEHLSNVEKFIIQNYNNNEEKENDWKRTSAKRITA